MSEIRKISEVRGVVMLTDGSTSEFSIFTDGGWQQWAAATERLGATVGAMEAISEGLLDRDLLESDHCDDGEF